MSNRRRQLLLVPLGAVTLAAGIWFLLGGEAQKRAPRHGTTTASDDTARTHAGTTVKPPGASASRLEVLLRVLHDEAEPETTAALRRLLRRSAQARRDAEEILLAGDTPRDLRMVLALVLGTLPGNDSDAVLLEALERFAEDIAVARQILFALGATREPPEEDDVFGLGDRPWGIHGPGGIGITVRREIKDPRLRRSLTGRLRSEEPGIREAAALALRHTTHAPDVRGPFLAALGAETSDDVALVIGEALAVWAGGAPVGGERTDVVTQLLSRAAEPDLHGLRFRMENDFRRIPVTAAQRATLREYAHSARPFDVRSFALSVLAASAARSGEDAVADVRGLLEVLLGEDQDTAVRDLSARLLRTLPQDPSTLARLSSAARSDPAWNVRHQALDTLATFGDGPLIREVLRAGTEDPDARVAARARELLASSR